MSYSYAVYYYYSSIITVYLEILAVIKFGDLPEIMPNALLAEFKFGGLPECVDNV